MDVSFNFVNNAWKEKLGYSEEEISGLSFLDIVSSESRDHCKEIFQKVQEEELLEKINATFRKR